MSPITSNWPSQRRLSVWYALALGLLSLNAVVTYWNLRTISQRRDQTSRTYDVIKSLGDVLSNLRDAETGQRGFLLTGEEAYLEPYNRAVSTIDGSMERLKELAGGDPIRRSNAEKIERIAKVKLAELAGTLRLQREQGFEAALAVVKSGRGKALMGAIVDQIVGQESEEVAARSRLREEQSAAIAQTILTFAVASGLALALVVVIHHLSQLSRRELALRAEWLSTTLQSIGDAVIATDPKGRVTFLNVIAEELTGWTAADAIGKALDDVFPICNEATREPSPNPVQKVLETGRIQGLANHTILLAKDGVERPIDDSAAPIRDDQGEIRGVVMVFRDITQRKIDESERERLNQELRENDTRKDEFLAMLAHELRNPLAAIGGAVMVSKKAGVAPGRIDWAMEVVNRQVRHLTRLIEDLLDVARINRGKIDLRVGLVEATPLLESAVESVRPLIEQRRHTLAIAIDRGALWVEADPTRLEQVVVNLLNNAAKYSDDGGRIEFSGVREGDDVVIAVKDVGFGISADMLPRVFEMFIQGDRSLSRSEGGLGIGLTVVKKLVDLHGGTITAESDGPGRGSMFLVRLPAASRPPTPEASLSRPPGALRSSRILVVDDAADHAQALSMLLKCIGHEVRTASHGEEALAIACDQRPEFILLDIGLPGMDGYEVASRLRRQEGSRDAVIIAVSGYGQDEDKRRSREAGFDHHLVKPVDHDALLALLSRS
ncbi:hybrid sensor histidine kinase/response regulator [Paludisphaera borealis]|uniref:histidine kinase n=1 Tax=Paludisphaera borealis TaxID=1387353 RepID=A0A1U7CTB9_9BACT|nr:CHASE3 domain-containing protein [Paludisphaera borealis]APW62185.1 Sensor histidine kinase TmoS [Paludisphaera borealis]